MTNPTRAVVLACLLVCLAAAQVPIPGFSSGGGGATAMSGLTDTSVATASDKDGLFYDSATSKWTKRSVAGGATGCLDFTTPWNPDFLTTCLTSLAWTWTGYHNFSGGALRLPESAFASLPSAASNPGKVYALSDSVAATACSTASVMCRSNGTSWLQVGGSSTSPNFPESQIRYGCIITGNNNATAYGGPGWLNYDGATQLSPANMPTYDAGADGSGAGAVVNMCVARFNYDATNDKWVTAYYPLPNNYSATNQSLRTC